MSLLTVSGGSEFYAAVQSYMQTLRVYRLANEKFQQTGVVLKAPVAPFQEPVERWAKIYPWIFWPGLLILAIGLSRLMSAYLGSQYQFGNTTVELASFTRRGTARFIDMMTLWLPNYVLTVAFGLASQEQIAQNMDKLFDSGPEGLMIPGDLACSEHRDFMPAVPRDQQLSPRLVGTDAGKMDLWYSNSADDAASLRFFPSPSTGNPDPRGYAHGNDNCPRDACDRLQPISATLGRHGRRYPRYSEARSPTRLPTVNSSRGRPGSPGAVRSRGHDASLRGHQSGTARLHVLRNVHSPLLKMGPQPYHECETSLSVSASVK